MGEKESTPGNLPDEENPLSPSLPTLPSDLQGREVGAQKFDAIVEQSGDARPTSPFAVPEGEQRHGLHLTQSHVVVPEAGVRDEEELVHHTKRSLLESTRFVGRKYDNWFIFLLFIFVSLAVIGSMPGVGMAWDEAYYVDAAEKTVSWVQACFDWEEAPVKGAALDAFWDAYDLEPRGHPSVTRFLTAGGLFLFGEKYLPLTAIRLPIAVCFALTIVLLYLLARLTYGRITGWLTIAAYLFMPRIFGHAHFALTETPMVLMVVASTYAFIRGLKSGKWAVVFGVLLGLSFATKINAVFIPAMLLPWAFLFFRKESSANLYGMLLISPLVMVLAWPWLWDETFMHLIKYSAWNFSHRQIGLFYFGQVYNDATVAVPWHYPLSMVAFTLPEVTLGLCILGLARVVRAPCRHKYGLLFLFGALVPCLVVSMPSSPKYDGVRLFITAFPFLSLLAGIGGGVLVRMGAFFDAPLQRLPRGQFVLIAVTLAVVVNGTWALISVAPNYLTYYNHLIGGRQNASQLMESTYWGEALNKRALDAINELVPDGASISIRAMNIEVLKKYQEWGMLKPGIRLVSDQHGDYHLVQYRRGMFTQLDWTLVNTDGGNFQKIATFPSVTDMGMDLPLILLYSTPEPIRLPVVPTPMGLPIEKEKKDANLEK